MKSIFSAILLLLGFGCFAQTGTITIKDNAGAGALVEKHIFFNKEHGELQAIGYRCLQERV